MKKKELGNWGERLAVVWLAGKGLELIREGFRSPHGEIDIIMRENEQIVFVEVKTRRSDRLGFPESAINQKKFQHIVDSAEFFIQQNPGYGDNWRIDVLAIMASPNKQNPDIQWFKNVHP